MTTEETTIMMIEQHARGEERRKGQSYDKGDQCGAGLSPKIRDPWAMIKGYTNGGKWTSDINMIFVEVSKSD